MDGVVLYANEETPRSVTNQNYLGYPNPTFAISLNLHLQRAVVSIMDSINPRTLTIIASPWSFASLVPYQLDLWDSWAFKIQYQTLRLEQDTSDTNIPNTSLTPFDIFSLRPWRHVTYNEGCSVPAYSTYEYFHKCTPSLLGVSPHIQQKPEGWMAHLTSFDFFAIFPFNHIENVCEFLRQLVHLKYLRTQLAPSAKCGVLDDPAAMGTCQRADLWAEFEIAHRYLLIIIHSFALQSLIEYTALDYTTPELRSVIDRVDEHELFNKSWCHDGNGKWTRN